MHKNSAWIACLYSKFDYTYVLNNICYNLKQFNYNIMAVYD